MAYVHNKATHFRPFFPSVTHVILPAECAASTMPILGIVTCCRSWRSLSQPILCLQRFSWGWQRSEREIRGAYCVISSSDNFLAQTGQGHGELAELGHWVLSSYILTQDSRWSIFSANIFLLAQIAEEICFEEFSATSWLKIAEKCI